MTGRSMIVAGAALAWFAVSGAFAQTPDQIDAAVKAGMAMYDTPSASVAVVKDGKIVYAHAFGDASLSPQVPATPSSRYQIASVSKQFTAAAVLSLVEDGKMSLDDKVAKWFPDLTAADTITVRQLLSHTSGMSDYWPQDYVMQPMTEPTTPQQIAERFGKAPLDYQPGEDWQYSNTGYVVAGLIVEKVSGKPLFQLIQDRLLKPAGITDALDIAAGDLTLPDALGYQRQGLGPNRLTPLAGKGWTFGAWPLALTAEDVAKWDITVMNRTLLKPETYDEQIKTIKLNDGKDTGYAMGLFVRQDNGHTLLSHGGEGAGYLSDNRVYPDDKLAIVVLTNTMSGNAQSEIGNRIAFMFMPPQGVDAKVLRLFQALQKGEIDRTMATENLNAYFSDQALADFKANLGPLGEPVTLSATGTSLRGGMDIKGYRLRTASGKLLSISVFVTKDGRFEQFLVNEVK